MNDKVSCVKCDWTGTIDECDYWHGLICPECGAEVIALVPESAGAQLMNTAMDMVEKAVEG